MMLFFFLTRLYFGFKNYFLVGGFKEAKVIIK